MNCEMCGKEVTGELGIEEGYIGSAFVIAIIEVSRRDWLLCDSCNRVVCHDCCQYPRSGYCDACIAKFDLYDYLVEVGLIQDEI